MMLRASCAWLIRVETRRRDTRTAREELRSFDLETVSSGDKLREVSLERAMFLKRLKEMVRDGGELHC